MKLDIDRTLDLPVSADVAWSLLGNVEGVAACMPGARITERIDDTHYKGAVAIKLGPASVTFKGELEILAMDPATRQIRVVGKGADGASSAATLELNGSVRETGADSSQLTGKSEVTINGKVASFGARLINSASDQLINQFYANFLKQAETAKATAAASPEATAAAAAAPPAQPAEPPKLNALALIWAMIKDLIGGLFPHKRTTRGMG